MGAGAGNCLEASLGENLVLGLTLFGSFLCGRALATGRLSDDFCEVFGGSSGGFSLKILGKKTRGSCWGRRRGCRKSKNKNKKLKEKQLIKV